MSITRVQVPHLARTLLSSPRTTFFTPRYFAPLPPAPPTPRAMSSNSHTDDQIPEIILKTRQAASGIPGEQVEPRQVLPSEDMEPDASKSIKLPANRQKLIDDVIALYSCQPTVERVARYAPGASALSLIAFHSPKVMAPMLMLSVRVR